MQILWLEGPSAAREKLCAFLASFPGCGGNPAPVSVETRLPRSPLPRGGAGGRCPSPGLQPLSGWERPQSPFNLSVPLLPCLPFLLSFRAQNRILEPALLYGLRGGRCTGARACEPPCVASTDAPTSRAHPSAALIGRFWATFPRPRARQGPRPSERKVFCAGGS